jgi:plasmid replication initiation protein
MLIEANYKLGVVEQKIILCVASNIQPDDSDFKTYTLPIKEFYSLLGLKGTPKYTELRQITRELMQKVFEVRIENKVIQVAWLSYVAYNETEGTIDLRFDPFLRPYLLQLKREFTSYKLENVVKLKSSYAIRIYELLKQYEKVQERTFSLSDLRKALGAEAIYPAYGNFKQRVLMPAQKELKKKTDISFEIEEVKKGRRVEKIKFFIISQKNKKTEQLGLFEKNLEQFRAKGSSYEPAKKLAMSMGFKLTEATFNRWITQHGEERVFQVMNETRHKKNIVNPAGYITHMLQEVTAGGEEAAPAKGEGSNHEEMLFALISRFKNSKEALPYWYVEKEAIQHITNEFEMDSDSARSLFSRVKEELYDALGIKEIQEEKMSEEQFLEEKRKLEQELATF